MVKYAQMSHSVALWTALTDHCQEREVFMLRMGLVPLRQWCITISLQALLNGFRFILHESTTGFNIQGASMGGQLKENFLSNHSEVVPLLPDMHVLF